MSYELRSTSDGYGLALPSDDATERAFVALQQAVNQGLAMLGQSTVTVDGKIGKNTLQGAQLVIDGVPMLAPYRPSLLSYVQSVGALAGGAGAVATAITQGLAGQLPGSKTLALPKSWPMYLAGLGGLLIAGVLLFSRRD